MWTLEKAAGLPYSRHRTVPSRCLIPTNPYQIIVDFVRCPNLVINRLRFAKPLYFGMLAGRASCMYMAGLHCSIHHVGVLLGGFVSQSIVLVELKI